MGGYGGGWYNSSKGNKLDVDLKQVASDGALTTKAVGDAFMGVAQVMEDRKKQNTEDEKNRIALDRAYAEDTRNAIDKTYLGYVDHKTGKFNQEQFDKDNVGLPMNDVSKEARKYQVDLERAYSADLKQIDEEANKAISNQALREMFKANSKDDFTKNINPDLLDRVDGATLNAIDTKYNTKAIEEAKLANTAAKIENTIAMGNSKLENEKLRIQIEQEKLDNKKNKPKEVKAADDSLIVKNVVGFFGGAYDPVTQKIVGLDKNATKKISEISASASKYFKENNDMTHNEATALALKDYEDSVKLPIPTFDPKDPHGWLKK